MKLISILFSVFIFASTVFSQKYEMNINLKDGGKITYDIKDILKIDFNNITNLENLKKSQNILKSFKLIQNYPNPFNPITTIQYEIPKNGKVEISIFDLSGRLVTTLLNQNQEAGIHKIIWNGKNITGTKVSTGFYIYRVKFENYIQSKKMILIK